MCNITQNGIGLLFTVKCDWLVIYEVGVSRLHVILSGVGYFLQH